MSAALGHRHDHADDLEMLVLTGLTKHFGSVRVIDGLDLTVQGGELVGILGPNGAGKSTLFNLIAGVLSPTEGHVIYRGHDITRTKPWVRCRRGIGRTYQVPKPFGHMTVFENVLAAAVHGGGHTIGHARRDAEEVLELTRLAPRHAQRAGTLSLLSLKQLELAKALAQRPRLLLLDEIAGGLTDAECELLINVIDAVRKTGTTIVWIEHVIHVLKRLASRLAVLYGGSIIADGMPEAVLADAKVQEVYLGA